MLLFYNFFSLFGVYVDHIRWSDTVHNLVIMYTVNVTLIPLIQSNCFVLVALTASSLLVELSHCQPELCVFFHRRHWRLPLRL